MRTHALFVLCAAALTIPTYAAPMSETMTISLPPFVPAATLAVNGVPEASNPPIPTESSSKKAIKKMERVKSPLPVLRRGVNFRQADYGVKPNVTFDDALRPVAGVEASPSTSASPAAHSRRWEPYAKYGADDLAADKSPNDLAEVDATPSVPPAAAATDASAVAGDVSKASSGDGSTSTSSSGDPVDLGNPTTASTNNMPIKPNFSQETNLLARILAFLGFARLEGSYAAHDELAKVMGSGANSTAPVPTSSDLEKTQTNMEKTQTNMEKTDRKLGLHRRVLAPASYLSTSAPVRRVRQLARDVALFVARHSLELNTDAMVPQRPDQVNMSDPYAVAAQQQKQRVGVINIDSNKQAPKPKPLGTNDTPLNSTELATNATETRAAPINNKQVDISKKQFDTTTGSAKKAA